jgi:PAS domain S-box-containing protein
MATGLLSTGNAVMGKLENKKYKGKPITETLTNGFFSVDEKWTVTYWNKAAEKLLGVTAKEITGKNLWKQFAAVLPIEFYTIYYKAFIKDIPVHFEEYWGEMGAWFDVITYYSGTTLSVSFKSSNHPHAEYPENAEQRLRTLTELYKYVTEITNDCLWEWDIPAQEIFWIDGGHKRAFGYQIENALIPQSFWENRLHPEDKERIIISLNKTIADGVTILWEDEYRFRKADGEYAFVHDRGHIIRDEGVAVRMIGATQDISQRVELENKLVKKGIDKQREITDAVLTAQEKERAAIGRELHDNLNQVLAVTKIYLQMAKKSENKREVYLEKSYGFIVSVMEEIRKISKILVIPPANIISLFDNIENLVLDLNILHPSLFSFHTNTIVEDDLAEKLQLNIYRIIQEQVNNILKHSKATKASINISKQGNEIILLITDNGIGCSNLKEKTGVGIINIRSRAELYHGNVTIISEPGKGYQLQVIFPLINPL